MTSLTKKHTLESNALKVPEIPVIDSIENIISSVKHYSLEKKISGALLIYSLCDEKEKAKILNTWYQCNHNNPYADEIDNGFIESANPRFPIAPIHTNKKKNLQIIYGSILNNEGYKYIEDFFLGRIQTSQEFEIDRLLYIQFAISSQYNVISKELFNLAYDNWKKTNLQPEYYLYLLIKTNIDLLIITGDYEKALGSIKSVYGELISPEYESKIPWLKYQFTSGLIELMLLNYSSKIWSVHQLMDLEEKYVKEGFSDDELNKSKIR